MNNKCLRGRRRRAEGSGACALVSFEGATVDLIIFFFSAASAPLASLLASFFPLGLRGGGASSSAGRPLRVNSMSSRAAPQEVAAAAETAGAVQQERGPTGAFPLVLKKLMENPPRDACLGEGGGSVSGYTRPPQK